MKKIVIACDSFKGSLDSAAAAEAVEAGVRAVLPRCATVKVRMADGGEGTVAALKEALGGTRRTVPAHDPLMRPLEAEYVIAEESGTAFLEMAAACGLPLLAPAERDPETATTYGFGEMMADAVRRGCRHLLLGIGGSATNDAGTGALEALGMRFYDAAGNRLRGCGASLERIAAVDGRGLLPEIRDCRIEVLCDVASPFSGPEGAVRVFAAQKGADAAAAGRLEQGMLHFAEGVKREKGIDLNSLPGAGAAGGLGGGLAAFTGARLRPGTEMLLEAIGFDRMLEGADLVITGEGRMDAQTALGKAAAGVLRAARKKNIPALALAGGAEDRLSLNELGFCAVLPVVPGPCSTEEAMRPDTARRNIRETVIQALRLMQCGPCGEPQPQEGR